MVGHLVRQYQIKANMAEDVADIVGAMVTGNTETNITVTYQDSDNTLDFAVPAMSDSAAGVVEAAVQSEMETGSSTTLAVTPGRQHFHPSAAKAWAYWNNAGTILASFGVSSVTDHGTGDWSVNYSTSFSSVNYAVTVGGGYVTGVSAVIWVIESKAVGATRVRAFNPSNALVDPSTIGGNLIAFGDL